MNTQDEVIWPILVTLCISGEITEDMSRSEACDVLYEECISQNVTVRDGSTPAGATVGYVSDNKAGVFATLRHARQLLTVG